MTSVSGEQQRREFQSLLHQFVERKIELRAYEIYEQRGRAEGQALDDWVNAEAEVLRGSILSPLFRRA
jgi:hypothetical protein